VPEAPSPPAVELSDPERSVLRRLQGAAEPIEEATLLDEPGLTPEAVRGSLQRLRSKHLATSEEEHLERARLSARGEAARASGLPERRLAEALAHAPAPLTAEAVAALPLSEEERSVAIGLLRRARLVAPGMPLTLLSKGGPVPPFPEEGWLAAIADGGPPVGAEELAKLRRRGLVDVDHITRRRWAASSEGRALDLAEGPGRIGALTPELLREATWRTGGFRAYDVRAAVPRWSGARSHPYLAWFREFEEILVGLGFSEAVGPLVETEFWNNDALFMPQEHPARSIHDALSVPDLEGRPPDQALLERVKAAHEGRPLPGESVPISPGWQSPYDERIARRPVLRSQTTAVSVRYLAAHPKPPFRMYSLDRNFRREAVDATHHIEFGQCEGILGESGTTLRELVGIFGAVAEAIGLKELKFRPSYFPFTEPSIEGYVRHPRLGWLEVFPGGMFRPEVLRPLGVDVPVAAWGIGVTRLAMVSLGVNDIRELFLDDLDRLRGGTF
jgi:phenylalanyl-tRNA synthetase alpha chain